MNVPVDFYPLPPGDPADLGFDPDRLRRIPERMQRYVDAGKVPNLVTLVARRGQVVHFDARGYLSLEGREPVPPDALFRLFSNTKPMTGVAVMQLFEDGLLSPDDPISDYLPGFAEPRVMLPGRPDETEPARREITIRDCLTNTTGLPTQLRSPMAYRTEYPEQLEAMGWLGRGAAHEVRPRVEAMAGLPLSFHPGSDFNYHVGYPLVGVIIETVTGDSLEVFFRERLIEPLGMSETGFYLREDQRPRFTACYIPRRGESAWRLELDDDPASSEKVTGPRTMFDAGGGFGGLIATIGDYARFGQMLLNGGEFDGLRLLGRKSVEYMTANHTPGLDIPMTGPGYGWGLGVAVRTGEGGFPEYRSVGSYGWGGAAGTNYFADPAEELLCVCFTQVMRHRTFPGNDYQLAFQRLVYQALR